MWFGVQVGEDVLRVINDDKVPLIDPGQRMYPVYDPRWDRRVLIGYWCGVCAICEPAYIVQLDEDHYSDFDPPH